MIIYFESYEIKGNIFYNFFLLFYFQGILLEPSEGRFTVTADFGGAVQLSVTIRGSIPSGSNQNTDIIWEKRGAKATDTYTLPSTGPTYTIGYAMDEHAGVYNVYWRVWPFYESFIRLIVRGKRLCRNTVI